jgi:hypothetical protein
MKDWPPRAAPGKWSRSHRPHAGAVHDVMPAKTDAWAKEHEENHTKTVGSQPQPVHGRSSEPVHRVTNKPKERWRSCTHRRPRSLDAHRRQPYTRRTKNESFAQQPVAPSLD